MKRFIVLVYAVSVVSCGTTGEKHDAGANARFENYKNNFVEALWRIYPEWAGSQGYHRYDSMLIIPDEATRSREIAFMNANLDSLKKYDVGDLDDNNRTDYYMIQSQLQGTVWALDTEKSYVWNPAQYNVSSSFADMLNNNYDSLDVRLHNFYIKMANIPAYYAAAKKNISNPTLEHTRLAIDQNLGGVSVFENDLSKALSMSHLSSGEKDEIEKRAGEAIAAIKDFAGWLKDLRNDNPRSYRLGKDLYVKKFEYDIQSGYTPQQIYEKAVAHKKDLHGKMYELASGLWNKYMEGQQAPADSLQLIRSVIDKISLDHVKPDSFQAAIEKQLPELVEFINRKNLIYIDPSKPLVVRREPDYMSGVAGASISAPGPYDKNGNTYYNVGSLSGWDKDRAESYLREYNRYILQILNIHEAIPGHYTQLVYSNQSPSLIKSLFGSSSMVEGWAVYAERMMLENGYGDDAPEMWLMYYKWNLRSTCNTILDYSVHTMNMSREDAMHLLLDEAFQQKTEAENKWRRVSVTQVQLCCYFTGYTEIYDFREELKKKMDERFDLKSFHEKFLSYGSAPVRYIRQLMLADMDKSGD